MSARPSIFPPASEEADLIVSKWQRQSEELLLKRLLGTPEAGEELDDEDGDGGLPPLPPLDDEYATASDLGREE